MSPLGASQAAAGSGGVHEELYLQIDQGQGPVNQHDHASSEEETPSGRSRMGLPESHNPSDFQTVSQTGSERAHPSVATLLSDGSRRSSLSGTQPNQNSKTESRGH